MQPNEGSPNLATFGYGDIVTRADVARGIAIVAGVGGQLFLASWGRSWKSLRTDLIQT